MKIELTKDQVKMVYQMIVQSNWKGESLEVAVELKNKFGSEVEKILQNQEKEDK